MQQPAKLHFGTQSIQPGLERLVPPNRQSDAIIAAAAHKIPRHLRITAETRDVMSAHLKNVNGVDRRTFNYTVKEQDAAIRLLMARGLYIPNAKMEADNKDLSTRDVRSKYSVVWSRSSLRSGALRIERVLQCLCGIDHEAPGAKKADKRHIPWTYVGCLSFVTVITMHDIEDRRFLAVDSVSGILDHSDDCNIEIEMFKQPPIPLHPDVRAYALQLLRDHEPLYLVRTKCAAFAVTRFGGSPGDNHYRFVLANHETASLYRSITAESGIAPRSSAEDNIDKWFRAKFPSPPPAHAAVFRDSCLHYQAYQPGITDRFELIISTPDQQAAAWRFGHKNLVLTDLTFGFCSARALLSILMVLDSKGRGLPIAFIIFTARKHARAVHADYDTEVLTRLYGLFKTRLGKNSDGEEIQFRVAVTDMDPRERHALQHHWPAVYLLICVFHVRQAWRNALNKFLRSIPAVEDRKEVRARLSRFLVELIKTEMTYDDVKDAYNEEWEYFRVLATSRVPMRRSQGDAAIAFLTYLKSYVISEAYWASWSLDGAAEASRRLDVPVAAVPRTNNHLESFNGRIKGKYFAPYARSGRQPRIDSWLVITITKVIPDFFKTIKSKDDRSAYYASMMSAAPPPDRLGDMSASGNSDSNEAWVRELEADERAEESSAREEASGAVDCAAPETVHGSDSEGSFIDDNAVPPPPSPSPPASPQSPPIPFTPPSQLTELSASASPESQTESAADLIPPPEYASRLATLLMELQSHRAAGAAIAQEIVALAPAYEPEVRALLDIPPSLPDAAPSASEVAPLSHAAITSPAATSHTASPIRTTRSGLARFSPMKKEKRIQSYAT
ncbi:hypothetical protein FB107DRAFT_210336 [Schizophyllum commune]